MRIKSSRPWFHRNRIMASINQLLGITKFPSASGAVRDIKNSVEASIKGTRNEIRNIPKGIAQAATAYTRGAVNNGVNAGLNAVKGAVAQAFTGDFSGALTTLAHGPQDIVGGFLSGRFPNGVGGLGGGGGPVNTLQGMLSRADPMMSFQWYCDLPVVTPINGAPAGLSWEYVEEATPSFRNYQSRQIYTQGRQRSFTNGYTVDPITLHFYADVGNKSLNYLNAWDGAIVEPTTSSNAAQRGGGFGRPSDYQKTIKIYIVDPGKLLVVTLEYVECQPTNIAQLTLDSGSSTRLTYNVNFNVGDVFITAYGINNNLSGQALLSSLSNKIVNSIGGSIVNKLF
jgi:hypothetical protein